MEFLEVGFFLKGKERWVPPILIALQHVEKSLIRYHEACKLGLKVEHFNVKRI